MKWFGKFVIVIFVLAKSNCSCQKDLVSELDSYYCLVHRAEMAAFMGDSITAVQCYETAFKLKLPFQIDLHNALLLRPNVFRKTTFGFIKLFDEWLQIDIVYYHHMDDGFSDSKLIMSDLADYAWYNSICKEDYLNREHFHDSLKRIVNEDQEIRMAKSSSKRDSILRDVGIRHFHLFTELINQYGWPSPELDGEFNTLIYPILLHGTYYCGLSSGFKSIMHSAVLKGELNSHFYAKVCDKYNDWNLSSPQEFGEWHTTINGGISILDLPQLNKRRSEIFLEPYHEYCLKNGLHFQ